MDRGLNKAGAARGSADKAVLVEVFYSIGKAGANYCSTPVATFELAKRFERRDWFPVPFANKLFTGLLKAVFVPWASA